MSSSSARKAGEVQAGAAEASAQASLQATRETNELQRQMFMQGLLTQAPNLQAGQTAQAALMAGLGLGTPTSSRNMMMPQAQRGTGPGGQGPLTAADGSLVNADGTPYQQGANLNAMVPVGATQEELDAAAGTMDPGYFTQEFSNDEFYRDPSYQFRLDEGMRALRAQQASGGNRFGSQSLKDITNFAQGAASQEYGSAYDRYMRNRQTVYDRLSNLAGLSSNTASAVSSAGQGFGANIASNTMAGVGAANQARMGGATATAGGIVGGTNAMVGGINNAANNYWMMDYLKKGGD
jgi:hypothetical protein